jgi:hypothetical protein
VWAPVSERLAGKISSAISALNSRARRGKGAELHHQSERIHNDAGVFDSAVPQPVDDHAPDPHGSSRSWYAEKLSAVRTSPLEAGQHLFPLGDLLLDGEVQVRKCSPHATQNIFQTFQTWTLARKWNLLQHILPDEPNRGVDLTLVDGFFNELPDYGGVFLHQLNFPFSAD